MDEHIDIIYHPAGDSKEVEYIPIGGHLHKLHIKLQPTSVSKGVICAFRAKARYGAQQLVQWLANRHRPTRIHPKATSEQYRRASLDQSMQKHLVGYHAKPKLAANLPRYEAKQPLTSIGRQGQAAMHPQKESDAVGICGLPAN